LFKIGGNGLVQVSAALTVTVIFFLLFKIGTLRRQKVDAVFDVIGAFVLCMSYGCIDVLLHQHGTYWYAAFFTYYMPLIPLLLFVLIYDRVYDKLQVPTVVLLTILALMAAWSGETLSVGVVVLMATLLAVNTWIKKRVDIGHLLFFLSAMTGFLILICSPGIQGRAGDRSWGLAAVDDLWDNVRVVFGFLFFEGNRRYWLFVFAACFFLSISLYIKRRTVLELFCVIALAVLEIITALNYSLIQVMALKSHVTTVLSIIVILGGILIPICRHYYFKQERKHLMVLLASVMSVASLVVVPEIQHRVIIPFEICTLLLIYESHRELFMAMRGTEVFCKTKNGRLLVAVVAVLFAFGMSYVSFKNTAKIYEGYKENAVVNEYNEKLIEEAKMLIKNGEQVNNVTLKKLADDRYASVMLYQQEWFRPYVNSYYGLPQHITYTFE